MLTRGNRVGMTRQQGCQRLRLTGIITPTRRAAHRGIAEQRINRRRYRKACVQGRSCRERSKFGWAYESSRRQYQDLGKESAAPYRSQGYTKHVPGYRGAEQPVATYASGRTWRERSTPKALSADQR